MTSATSAITNSGAAQGASPSTATAAKQSQITQNQFLQLLVAQVKNQDPMQPTDGVQFLTQLAQFSQLEQTIGMRTDIQGIAEGLKPVQDKPASGDNSVV